MTQRADKFARYGGLALIGLTAIALMVWLALRQPVKTKAPGLDDSKPPAVGSASEAAEATEATEATESSVPIAVKAYSRAEAEAIARRNTMAIFVLVTQDGHRPVGRTLVQLYAAGAETNDASVFHLASSVPVERAFTDDGGVAFRDVPRGRYVAIATLDDALGALRLSDSDSAKPNTIALGRGCRATVVVRDAARQPLSNVPCSLARGIAASSPVRGSPQTDSGGRAHFVIAHGDDDGSNVVTAWAASRSETREEFGHRIEIPLTVPLLTVPVTVFDHRGRPLDADLAWSENRGDLSVGPHELSELPTPPHHYPFEPLKLTDPADAQKPARRSPRSRWDRDVLGLGEPGEPQAPSSWRGLDSEVPDTAAEEPAVFDVRVVQGHARLSLPVGSTVHLRVRTAVPGECLLHSFVVERTSEPLLLRLPPPFPRVTLDPVDEAGYPLDPGRPTIEWSFPPDQEIRWTLESLSVRGTATHPPRRSRQPLVVTVPPLSAGTVHALGTTTVPLVVDDPSAAVRLIVAGIVLGPEGQAIAGARVVVGKAPALETDGAGRFAMWNAEAPSDPGVLNVTHPDYLDALPTPFDSGTKDLVVRLSRPGRAFGRLVGPGAENQRFVVLEDLTRDAVFGLDFYAGGFFTRGSLAPGTYRLKIYHGDRVVYSPARKLPANGLLEFAPLKLD